jgi:hypothetical protein
MDTKRLKGGQEYIGILETPFLNREAGLLVYLFDSIIFRENYLITLLYDRGL